MGKSLSFPGVYFFTFSMMKHEDVEEVYVYLMHNGNTVFSMYRYVRSSITGRAYYSRFVLAYLVRLSFLFGKSCNELIKYRDLGQMASNTPHNHHSDPFFNSSLPFGFFCFPTPALPEAGHD